MQSAKSFHGHHYHTDGQRLSQTALSYSGERLSRGAPADRRRKALVA